MIDQATHVDHYGTPKQIVVGNDYTTLSIHCSNAGVSADADGKKILYAGTPLFGDLTNRATAFVKATTTAAVTGNLVVPSGGGTVVIPQPAKSNAVGILLHDVDVTSAEANATILVRGVVNLSKVDDTTAALVDAAVKTALPNVCFIKD